MKKTILRTFAIAIVATSLQAQDDVSIMDLKEVTYDLIGEVQNVKKNKETMVKNLQSKQDDMQKEIKALNDKIKSLSENVTRLEGNQYIKNYSTSITIKNYLSE